MNDGFSVAALASASEAHSTMQLSISTLKRPCDPPGINETEAKLRAAMSWAGAPIWPIVKLHLVWSLILRSRLDPRSVLHIRVLNGDSRWRKTTRSHIPPQSVAGATLSMPPQSHMLSHTSIRQGYYQHKWCSDISTRGAFKKHRPATTRIAWNLSSSCSAARCAFWSLVTYVRTSRTLSAKRPAASARIAS